MAKKIDLDKIAKKEGFIFLKKLEYENYVLYRNDTINRNRVYNSETGKIVYEYSPKIQYNSFNKFRKLA